MKEYITTKKGSVVQASPKRLLALASVALFAAILLASIAPTASADPGWWNDSWQYRKAVTIDHTKVPNVADPATTYANFPVLVSATGLSNIKADGADIRFTDSAGSQLPREIESYSNAGGILHAWVNVTLTKDAGDSADDVIYLYYGNSVATEPAADSTYGSENVWDSNYKGVWHLLGDGTTSLPESTSYSNTGTKNGTDEPANTASGQIDGAQDFDGTDDYVDCGNDDIFNLTSAGTVNIWIKIPPVWIGDTYPNLVSKGATAGWDTNGWSLFGFSNGRIGIGMRNGASTFYKTFANTIKDQWTHIVGTWDGSTVTLYQDGVYKTSASQTISPGLTTDTVQIGQEGGHYFGGEIDEVRISASARSADWIKTSYNNQNSPSTFCGFGGEEQKPCGSCQRWYLSSTAAGDSSYKMWKGDETKPSGTVTVGDDGEQIWRADEAASCAVGFAAGTWTGHLTFDGGSNDTTVRVWVGEWNGSTFTPSAAGENATIDGSGDFSISAGEFNVSKGEWLAFRIRDYADGDANSSVVSVGLSSSYLTSGATDPAYPIPELPAMILFLGGGRLCLLGMQDIEGRRKIRTEK